MRIVDGLRVLASAYHMISYQEDHDPRLTALARSVAYKFGELILLCAELTLHLDRAEAGYKEHVLKGELDAIEVLFQRVPDSPLRSNSIH